MKNQLLVWTIFFVSIFLVLTFLVWKGVFLSPDLRFMIHIQSLIPRSVDLPISLFSLVGTAEIVSLIFLILLFFSKGLNKLLVLSLYFLAAAVELLGKSLIHQEAPPISFLRTYQFFNVPSGEISGHFFSYPSGHSSRTAFVSGLFLYVIWDNEKLSRELKYFLSAGVILFDCLMFGSRVYLGEHWLTDVIGGAILGFCLFGISILLSRRFSAR